MLSEPVAAGKRHEQVAIEAASGPKVGILDLCIMAQLGGPGTGFEALLSAHGGLPFEQYGKPFSMLKTAGFGLCVKLLEGCGHAVKAEFAQHDQCTRSAYIFGAICPKLGKAAALVASCRGATPTR